MEISFTKLSPNGQVVIPSEIRKKAGLKPSTKFIVYNEGGNILLKEIKPETLQQDMQLLETIQRSEQQIADGNVTKATTDMDAEEIEDLLMN
jgi:AbrB family looped-hinge helix DNA binding protein